MTDHDLLERWQDYGVVIGGRTVWLAERYALCLGWWEQYGGVCFDTGGEVGELHSFRVIDDHLVSVNPDEPGETTVIGKLVKR